MLNVNILLGKTLVKVFNKDNEQLIFKTTEDETYKLFHVQDCCESVRIEDIIGYLNDLVGSPITLAEEVSGNTGYEENKYESCTWTFYKFATVKGYVTIRWLGVSNGFYSESVAFVKC